MLFQIYFEIIVSVKNYSYPILKTQNHDTTIEGVQELLANLLLPSIIFS